MVQVREEQAREVGVETFVARDELVGETESRHEAALLEPKDGRERACASATSAADQPTQCQEPVPEKKMPSTAANATSRSPKVDLSSEIHLSAQSAFFAMHGTGLLRRRQKGLRIVSKGKY